MNVVPPNELRELEGRMVWNLAGCMLARVGGKSRVDYLSATQQETVRNLARGWLVDPPPSWAAVFKLLAPTAG
jgi:hypothetical protein